MKSTAAVLLAVAATVLALAGPASAGSRYPQPTACGTGEPAYTGWNYWDLQAYGIKCSNAHDTASEYVYDFSTEGVIEPPEHWDRCKDKRVEPRMWKGKCTKTKDGRPQKITFLFTGPDQPWYRG